jgi:polysaccharide pyruvyl transferase CsaB
MAHGSAGREFDVLLLGYFGFGNLGDELLAESSVGFLKECGVPPERMAILSGDPRGSQERLGIRAFGRWSPLAVRSALGRSRSLLLAGGGLFQDSTSFRSPLYYWGVVRMARIASCPVWALGQSVGPLGRPLSRVIARDALRSCRYLAVRDETSLAVSKDLGTSPDVMPDIVIGICVDASGPRASRVALVNARTAPMRPECLDMLASSAKACAGEGYELRGVAFAPEDAAVLENMKNSDSVPISAIRMARSAGDFLDEARGASVAMGMRLHFAILSMKAGLPTAVSPYDPKVSAFAREWGAFVLNDAPDKKKYDGFDIMTLLTDTEIGDKRDVNDVHTRVARHFRKGLNLVLEGG